MISISTLQMSTNFGLRDILATKYILEKYGQRLMSQKKGQLCFTKLQKKILKFNILKILDTLSKIIRRWRLIDSCFLTSSIA